MFTFEVAGKYRKRKRPLQEALRSDLSALALQFVEQWSTATDETSSFDLFLRLFHEHNVALIHTQGLPPRCDAAGFAQIVSAACLQVALADENNLPQAAFGIFSLYALYESSPLPTLSSSPWQWLSMGLIHPDNPKLAYRRRFRPRIRIYRQLFMRLQQLKQTCLGLVGNKTKESKMASDLIAVLGRLEFDWCEYNGPRGVDALAVGIVDGCFVSSPREETIPDDTEAEEDTNGVEQVSIDALKKYYSSLQAIEVSSTTKQAKHVQTALAGLRGEHSWQDRIKHLTTAAGASVTTGEPFEGGEEQHKIIQLPGRISHDDTAIGITDQGDADPGSYRLRIPEHLSQSVEQGIMSSIEELLKRGENLLLPKLKEAPIAIAANKTNNLDGNGFLTLDEEVEPHFDSDMSDVSDEDDGDIQDVLHEVGEAEHSDDEDDDDDDDDHQSSAAGLQALNLLLKQAKPVAKRKCGSKKKQRMLPRASTRSRAKSSIGQKALTALLGEANDISSPKKLHSDVASVADSSVGRNALSALIEQAAKAKGGTTHQKKKRVNAKKSLARKRKPVDDDDEDTSIAASSIGHNALSSLLNLASAPKKATDDEADEVSVADTSIGRNALSVLLQQAKKPNRKKLHKKKVVTAGAKSTSSKKRKHIEQDDEASIAASSVGRNALSALLHEADQSTDDDEPNIRPAGDDTSVANSSVGRSALSTLLKRASKKSKRTNVRKVAARRISTRKRGKTEFGKTASAGRNAMSTFVSQTDDEILSVAVDEASVADSSVGRTALSNLLGEAANKTTSSTFRKTKQVTASRMLTRKRKQMEQNVDTSAPNNEPSWLLNDGDEHTEGDETSVAESSLGRNALSRLLQQATQEPLRENLRASTKVAKSIDDEETQFTMYCRIQRGHILYDNRG